MQVTAEVNGAIEIFATIVAVILLIDNIISKGKERQTAGLEQYTKIEHANRQNQKNTCILSKYVLRYYLR